MATEEIKATRLYEVRIPNATRIDDDTHRLSEDEAKHLLSVLLWAIGDDAQDEISDWEVARENEK